MAIKAFDEVLVELLLSIQPNRIKERVYHLEQYQMDDTLHAAYPNIVYELIEDRPDLELSGDSQFRWADYMICITSENSEDIRVCATNLKNANDPDFNATLTAAYNNIQWVTVTQDVEASIFAVEQQEKGLKTASLTMTLHHWGDV